MGLATDYTDEPELLLVDLDSGRVSRASDSQGGDDSVSLGPDGTVAFCDAKGAFRVGTLDRIDQSAILEEHDPSAGCPTSAWRGDLMLAFIAGMPLDSPEPSDEAALYLREPNGDVANIPLPGLLGFGQPSWSSDGKRVTFAAGGFSIVVLDVESSDFQILGDGSDPIFSPTDPSRLAAYRYGQDGRVVEVWENDSVVASLPSDEAGFDWCPGGEEIALATTAAIVVWNWRTGDTRIMDIASVLDNEARFFEHAIACY